MSEGKRDRGRPEPPAAGAGGASAQEVERPQGSGERSDRELVREAQRGSHAAFEELVRRHSERAFRAAYRVVRDEELARDVVQEALIKAYLGLRRFESRSAFYTWLYRIVVNLALDRRRRDRGGASVAWEDEVARETDVRAYVPEPEDPELATRRSQVLRIVADGIQQLPEGQRQVLLLREVDGLSYDEIAATMRISKGTVMSRLHYARRKMMVFLRRHDVDPEDVS